ncbi:hypothetical protein [Pontibacter chitinilyticus]|uniref:hypothetical protein n=1 Tax=Pontibacter chitinilyticus TaxID=2674989 RepID=UPI00321A2B9A
MLKIILPDARLVWVMNFFRKVASQQGGAALTQLCYNLVPHREGPGKLSEGVLHWPISTYNSNNSIAAVRAGNVPEKIAKRR